LAGLFDFWRSERERGGDRSQRVCFVRTQKRRKQKYEKGDI